MTYNVLDYLLVLILVIGTFWSMMRGVVRLLIGILSLYIGLVVSLLLYLGLSAFLRRLLPSMSLTGSQALSFVFILIVSTNLLDFFTRFLSTPAEERQRKKKGGLGEVVEESRVRRFLVTIPSLLVSTLVGFFVTVVWMSLALAILQFLLRTGGSTAGGIAGHLSYELGTSTLVPMFNYVLYRVYQSVSLWLPAHNTPPSLFSRIFQVN